MSQNIDPAEMFIREVDEDVRRDQLLALWKKYSPLITGGLFAIVLAVAGYNYYQQRQIEAAAATSVKLQAAIDLADAGKHEEAAAAFGALRDRQPYTTLARLHEAGERMALKDQDRAMALLDEVAKDGTAPSELRELAKLRSIEAKLDSLTIDEARAQLQPLATQSAPFRFTAHELLAAAALKASDKGAAETELRVLVTDPAAPSGMKRRAEDLLASMGIAVTPSAKDQP